MKFSEKDFNEQLNAYYKYKKDNPYYYEEWKTSGDVAKKCKGILENIAGQLEDLLGGMNIGKKPQKRVSPGASYFPRSPWIGFFFDGEKPTRGVYPLLGFYGNDDGLFIGCVASIKHVQIGFSAYTSIERCEDEQQRDTLKRIGLDKNEHVAKPVFVFSAGHVFTKDELIKAFQVVIDVYRQYKGVNNGNNGGATSEGWYKCIQVDNVEKWLSFVADDRRFVHWGFRGQGDSEWMLESSLGRKVQYDTAPIGTGAKFREAENVAIKEFGREARKQVEYRNSAGVEMLALMQHYGSKTRLLDFSHSPLVAVFWALQQHWALKSGVEAFLKEREDVCRGVRECLDGIGCSVWCVNLKDVLSTSYAGTYPRMLEQSLKYAESILTSFADETFVKGIDVVHPEVNNPRISAQDGLFLMPRNLDVSFQENLINSIPAEKREVKDAQSDKFTDIANMDQLLSQYSVIKFDFGSKITDRLSSMLKGLGVSYKTIYPDLTGLALGVADRIVYKE